MDFRFSRNNGNVGPDRKEQSDLGLNGLSRPVCLNMAHIRTTKIEGHCVKHGMEWIGFSLRDKYAWTYVLSTDTVN